MRAALNGIQSSIAYGAKYRDIKSGSLTTSGDEQERTTRRHHRRETIRHQTITIVSSLYAFCVLFVTRVVVIGIRDMTSSPQNFGACYSWLFANSEPLFIHNAGSLLEQCERFCAQTIESSILDLNENRSTMPLALVNFLPMYFNEVCYLCQECR